MSGVEWRGKAEVEVEKRKRKSENLRHTAKNAVGMCCGVCDCNCDCA